ILGCEILEGGAFWFENLQERVFFGLQNFGFHNLERRRGVPKIFLERLFGFGLKRGFFFREDSTIFKGGAQRGPNHEGVHGFGVYLA
ncbi:hypothetical protein, partial [Heyndrickxia coagulans]|uniref:hypothetical protein n=1 Tax=Heyndrickxia coagulans TaxID=1398 RepID=UPI00214D7106